MSGCGCGACGRIPCCDVFEEGRAVLVTGFPAGPWGANCFVLASGEGSECILIDPGMDCEAGIAEILSKHHLRPSAVLLTHGHLDHTWSVAPVADGYGIPAYIHPSDREQLTNPLAGISPETQMMMSNLSPDSLPHVEPDDVRDLSDGLELDLAGIKLTVDEVPGHTPGSVVFRCFGDGTIPPLMFSGDFLFAGSIGRTDLPGGDHQAMLRSLASVVLSQRDEMVVLPGHGPQTTIGQERATNPFLAGMTAEPAGPTL
ncbi:MAG: MBL fold metallo-hydrolase [Candidatus Nanopelagicales bacterium]|nr:MBL fold metallo-hydrolase [Candidatus Nanopelagicales bacterium]